MVDGPSLGDDTRGAGHPKSLILAALRFARGEGGVPAEIETGRLINRFGVSAIYSGPMGYGEMIRINITENIVSAYRGRKASDNWAEWATQHPEYSRLLIMAEQTEAE